MTVPYFSSYESIQAVAEVRWTKLVSSWSRATTYAAAIEADVVGEVCGLPSRLKYLMNYLFWERLRLCQCRFVVAGALRTSCSQGLNTTSRVYRMAKGLVQAVGSEGSICVRLLLFARAGMAIKKKRIEKLLKSREKSVETLCK